MTSPRSTPNPQAAGVVLALAILIGSIVGAVYHQPTIGFLAGVALGTVVAIVMWLRDRGRIGR